MSGSFNENIRHFDCEKNKVPKNFFSSSVKTGHYAYCIWGKNKCEYGPNNPCKENSDKWNICNRCTSKWTTNCNQSPTYHYFDSYTKKCNSCDEKYQKIDNECYKNDDYYKNECCKQVSVVFRGGDENIDCDNIVELSLPKGGSKENYMAKHFSPEFVKKNRFQCATVPYINAYQGNIIDNMREEEFTVSDQRALVMRGVREFATAQKLLEDGDIINDKHNYKIPMNVCGRTSYYKFGSCGNTGSTITGLGQKEHDNGYFPKYL